MNIIEKIEEMEKEIAELKKQVEAEKEKQDEFPRNDEYYFYATSTCCVNKDFWHNDRTDNYRRLIGIVYRTKEEAEMAIETKIKYFEMAKESWNGEKIDWNQYGGHNKYFLCYSNDKKAIEIREFAHTQYLPHRYYFASGEALRDAMIELGHNNIKKYILEVE